VIAGPAIPGACPQWNAGDLVVVNAVQPQPGLAGASVSPSPGCQFATAAAISGGAVAVEDCQSPQSDEPSGTYIDGPVHLVRFDANLHVVASTSLGECNDGAELATDPQSSAVLVSGYFCCSPPGPPASNPVARVWIYTPRGLRQVTEVSGNGAGVNDITW
jgi:hypothetical protein